ncbi:helix-turn-helix domain-containing protein [Enterococcus bulliens]
MDITQQIGQNLHQLRTTRKLTLDELAQQTGISKGMLSQIEKGTTNPTINTIWKISEGLHIPYTTLIGPPILPTCTVIAKKDAIFQEDDAQKYRIFNYFQQNTERNFEFFEMELDPGHRYDSIGHYASSEYVFVLEGTLTLTLEQQLVTLEEEEATYFVATQPHRYENRTDKLMKAVVINFYPQKK